jgi:hypothetical protein
MTEKRQTSQGYIIRILQHFATKLWNITNFVMLFQAMMKCLSGLVEFKILVNWGTVHCIGRDQNSTYKTGLERYYTNELN